MTAATFTPITAFTPDTIATDMQSADRYVLWKPSTTKDGKPTKVPCNANGIAIDDKDPDNWRPLSIVVREAMATGYGIAFALGDGWTGIDHDNCRHPETGELTPWAAAIMARFPGWRWEISPSLTGIKGIGRTALTVLPGELAGGRRGTNTGGLPDYLGGTTGKIETYVGARMFCTTGNAVNDVETFEDTTSEYVTFYLETFGQKPAQKPKIAPSVNDVSTEDVDIIADCRRFKNGPKFERLMQGSTAEHGGDDSAADIALASIIAFRTKDPDQIERIMRLGSLQRDKWDEKRGDTTYLRRTIEKAIETVSGSYNPNRGQSEPLGAAAAADEATICVPAEQWQAMQAENARLRAENATLKTRILDFEGIHRNRGLGNCKDTAVALLSEAETAHKAGRVKPDGWFEIQMAAQQFGNPAEHTMQQLAGRSADTVRRDLKHFERAGILQTNSKTEYEKWTDAQTGEVIAGPRTRAYIRLLCPVEEVAQKLATVDLKPLGRKTKEPKVCPACGIDAGVTVKTIEVCNGCGFKTELPDRERQPVAEEPQVADPLEPADDHHEPHVATPLQLVPMEAEPAAPKEPQVAAHLRNNHRGEDIRKEPQVAVPLAGPSPPSPTLAAIVQDKATFSEYQRTTEELKQSHLANGKTYRLTEASA